MLSPNSTCWVLSSPDNLQNLSWPGACVGLEICQLVIGQILEGLPNASNIADDFLVHGATKEEHYKSLESTLLLLHKRHLLIQSIHSSVYLVSQNWTTMDFTSQHSGYPWKGSFPGNQANSATNQCYESKKLSWVDQRRPRFVPNLAFYDRTHKSTQT